MTSNQIAARSAAETERSNKAKEAETYRSNRAKEKETTRHNRHQEAQGYIKNATDVADSVASFIKMGKGKNHPEWYTRFPGVVETTASLAWGAPYGTGIARKTLLADARFNARMAPNFCIVRYAPSVGRSENGSSPVNIAAQRLYSFVRHANSGARNYENADLYIYLLAVSACYSFNVEIRRAIKACFTYSPENYALGRFFVQALGFNYDDLSENMADLRKWLEIFTAKVNQFLIPSDWYYLARQAWMNSVVAVDNANTKKAQMYAFKPSYYYKFTTSMPSGEAGAGGLDAAEWHNYTEPGTPISNLKTVADIKAFGDALIDAIYTNEDVGIISGDIMKAYGDKVYHIDSAISTDPLEFSADEKTLEVFANANLLPARIQRTSLRVYQSVGSHYLVSVPRFEGFVEGAPETGLIDQERILISKQRNPDPTYTSSIAALATVQSLYRVESCGTEVPIQMELWRYSTTGGGTYLVLNKGRAYVINGTTPSEIENDFNIIDTLAKYSHAPEYRLVMKAADPLDYTIQSTMDIDNYVVVNASDLEAIHNNMLLSILSVF